MLQECHRNADPAVAGGASPAVFARASAPADLAGTMFPVVAGDLSLADDAGGLPSAVRVSELLWAASEADPLIDAEEACTRTNSVSGCGGGIADLPPAGQPMQSIGEPQDLDNDRHCRGTAWITHTKSVMRGMGCCRIVERRLWSGPWLGCSVVPDRVDRGS